MILMDAYMIPVEALIYCEQQIKSHHCGIDSSVTQQVFKQNSGLSILYSLVYETKHTTKSKTR